ncbi:MAG: chalcone isomerase family protein [bacterium]|nr:chalcone isomerase family protein [bacterium]
MPRHRSLSRPRALLAALTVLLAAPPSFAAEIEDVPFPDQVTSDAGPMPLFGLGLLRYRVLFRGYVGGLYLPTDVRPNRLFEDVPKALELYYFWDIEGRFFGEAADELLARSLPPERLAALRSRLDRLHALYRDVEEGDRYRLTYSPGVGTTLTLNGEALGTIPGADFAADYFGIWLGDDPLNAPFRDQMLRGLSKRPE